MKRFGQVIKVKPEKLEEYTEAHAAVWPEVLEMITKCKGRFRTRDELGLQN